MSFVEPAGTIVPPQSTLQRKAKVRTGGGESSCGPGDKATVKTLQPLKRCHIELHLKMGRKGDELPSNPLTELNSAWSLAMSIRLRLAITLGRSLVRLMRSCRRTYVRIVCAKASRPSGS